MNAARTWSIVVLGCLAGALVGFGLGNPPGQRAAASADPLANTGTEQTSLMAANTAPTATVAAQTEVAIGGSFVSDVYQEVSPAVVHITNKSVYETFDFFMRRHQFETESTGSGVIVRETGYILTNYHVIADARQIVVVLNDGREFLDTEVIGADPGTDLALLKVEPETPLPTAALGDSDAINVGEWVVAIGNPRGLDWTVTAGVVSAMGREGVSQTGQTISGLIQTDASINPGNSGGPLLNARGEVIGINEMIVSGSGGSEGIGLAIPINTAKEVLNDLETHGRVIRAWLGIRIAERITPSLAAYFDLPVDFGFAVKSVFTGSPADIGGIEPYFTNRRTFHYDIITRIGNERLDEERELLDVIRSHSPGDRIEVEVYRIVDGEYSVNTMQIDLAELPADAPLMGIV
jgi:S1-C subfamily serine protease